MEGIDWFKIWRGVDSEKNYYEEISDTMAAHADALTKDGLNIGLFLKDLGIGEETEETFLVKVEHKGFYAFYRDFCQESGLNAFPAPVFKNILESLFKIEESIFKGSGKVTQRGYKLNVERGSILLLFESHPAITISTEERKRYCGLEGVITNRLPDIDQKGYLKAIM